MLKRMQLLAEERDILESELKLYFSDTGVPLDARWEAYEYAIKRNLFFKRLTSWYDCPTLEHRIPHPAARSLLSPQSSRHEFKTFPGVISTLDDFGIKVTEEEIIEMKEQFLQSGYSGFVYDW